MQVQRAIIDDGNGTSNIARMRGDRLSKTRIEMLPETKRN
jgi:hypothetical protein